MANQTKNPTRVSVTMTQEQADDLNDLVNYTRIRQADYLREAVELLLEKHAEKVREAKRKKNKGT